MRTCPSVVSDMWKVLRWPMFHHCLLQKENVLRLRKTTISCDTRNILIIQQQCKAMIITIIWVSLYHTGSGLGDWKSTQCLQRNCVIVIGLYAIYIKLRVPSGHPDYDIQGKRQINGDFRADPETKTVKNGTKHSATSVLWPFLSITSRPTDGLSVVFDWTHPLKLPHCAPPLLVHWLLTGELWQSHSHGGSGWKHHFPTMCLLPMTNENDDAQRWALVTSLLFPLFDYGLLLTGTNVANSVSYLSIGQSLPQHLPSGSFGVIW